MAKVQRGFSLLAARQLILRRGEGSFACPILFGAEAFGIVGEGASPERLGALLY
jgi:hypothetical protein